MRLPLTSYAYSNALTDGMFAANTSEYPMLSVVQAANIRYDAGLQDTAGPTLFGSHGEIGIPMIEQIPVSSSCLFAGRRPRRTHGIAPGSPIQAHEPSEWTYTRSHTSMITPAAAHTVHTTDTDAGFGTGANGLLPGEPPRHTMPLYKHDPLPPHHVELHPALDYDGDAEWHTSRSPPGLRNHHWSEPATNPVLRRLTIILSTTRHRMTVYPSPSPENSYGGFVTVWDVLIAVEMAMSRLDMTDDACLRHLPAINRSSARQVMGRRCVCRGEIPSLDYLRQRYERAGLVKAREDDDIWILHVGHRR